MKLVVQRVISCELFCDNNLISKIGKGLVIYVGVKQGDTLDKAIYLAKKVASLRVFNDNNGKMNLSVNEVDGEVLAVSQFTLLGDVSHGNRPSFSNAESPDKANLMYEFFIEKLVENGCKVKKGVFGGDMKIAQLNDGPVTIIYDI